MKFLLCFLCFAFLPGLASGQGQPDANPNAKQEQKALPSSPEQQEMVRLSNEGVQAYRKGQFSEAVKAYQAGLAIAEKLKNDKSIAGFLNNIGNAYLALRQYEQALSFFQQVLAANEKTGSEQGLGASLGNIGNVYYARGQYKQALTFFQRAQTHFEKLGDEQFLSKSLGNLGAVYFALSQYETALTYHQRALTLREKVGNQHDISVSLNNLGILYNALGQSEKALDYYQRALALFEQTGNQQNISASLNNLGILYDTLGKPAKAEAFYVRGIARFETFSRDVVTDPAQLGDLLATTALYQNYAHFLIEQRRPTEALNALESGRARGVALQLAASRASLARFFTPEEAARLNILKTEATLSAKTLVAVKARPAPLEKTEQAAYSQHLLEVQAKAKEALQHYELFRDALADKHPQLKRLQGERARSPQELSRFSRQHPGTLYLEFAVIKWGTLLLTLQDGVQNAKTILRTQQQVEALVRKWREAIAGRTEDEPKLAQTLYTLLLQPVASLLANPKVTHLVVVADGTLLDIPFAALRDKTGKRLIERFPVSNALSLGILLWPENSPGRTRGMLCIADTRGEASHTPIRGGFGALPAAREEGKTIAGLYPTGSLLIGAQATEAKVKSVMSQYALLHFATHGDLDTKNGLRSALVLAEETEQSENDGFLDGREIVEIGVSAKLAVLSACESGQGKKSGGEGLQGLAWAFRAAGCPSIVASQWKVDDSATKELMVAFYKGLKAGKRKDDALRDAMRLVKKSKPSPFFWSAFQVIGETDALYDRK